MRSPYGDYDAIVSPVLRVLSLSIAAAALAACGNVHPGAAVVVGDRTISMSSLDDRAAALCLVQLASQQQVQAIDNGVVRQNAAAMLAVQEIAAAEVSRQHLAVDDKLAALPVGTDAQVDQVFGDDAPGVKALLVDQQRLYAQFIALGSESTGQLPNSDILDQLAETGQSLVRKAFARYDVEFAPRLGLEGDGNPVAGYGSKSVAAPKADEMTTPAPGGCSQ